MESYVGKVTVAGQITLPKRLRELLEIGEGSLIEFVSLGDAIILRKLRGEEDFLRKVRARIKKSGISRERAQEIAEEAAAEEWADAHGSGIR